MTDEKLLSEIRLRLKGHTEAVKNATGDEYDILPSLFSVLLESQIDLNVSSKESLNDTQKNITELLNNHQDFLSGLSVDLSGSTKLHSENVSRELLKIQEVLIRSEDGIKQHISITSEALTHFILLSQEQIKIVKKKNTINLYFSVAAIVILVAVALKVFMK